MKQTLQKKNEKTNKTRRHDVSTNTSTQTSKLPNSPTQATKHQHKQTPTQATKHASVSSAETEAGTSQWHYLSTSQPAPADAPVPVKHARENSAWGMCEEFTRHSCTRSTKENWKLQNTSITSNTDAESKIGGIGINTKKNLHKMVDTEIRKKN